MQKMFKIQASDTMNTTELNLNMDGPPTAADFRKAAQIIRYVCNRSDMWQAQQPPLKRLWLKLTRESNREMLRKAAIIEHMGDI